MQIRLKYTNLTILLLTLVGAAHLASATKRPADDPNVDWLLSSATTQPAARPTTRPAMPTSSPVVLVDPIGDSRLGTITLSDGSHVTGSISTTAERPVRVWVEADKSYHDLPFDSIRSIDAVVLWERMEREWTFKATGSDVKVYSGRTYPARDTQYRFTLDDGTIVTGACVAPLYLHRAGGEKTYVLYKRDKGPIGQKLNSLVFVRHVAFAAQITTPAGNENRR